MQGISLIPEMSLQNFGPFGMPYCAKLPDIIPHYPSEEFQPITVLRNSAQSNDAETANKRQKNLNKL